MSSAMEAATALLASDQATFDNPYPHFAQLRSAGPLFVDDATTGAAWHLARYDDVRSAVASPLVSTGFSQYVARDREKLSVEQRERLEFSAPCRSRTLLRSNPPDHTRVRALMTAAVTPRAMGRLEAQIVQTTQDLLCPHLEAGQMDVIGDFAAPLPAMMIAAILGVPVHDYALVRKWADDLVLLAPQSLEAHNSAVEMLEYLRALVGFRKDHPGDDLLTQLGQAVSRGQLTEDELIAQCRLLLVAGHETTTNLIGNGLLALLRHPEQMGVFRSRSEGTDQAIEEMLRYDSPVQHTWRFTTGDLQLTDTTIPSGQNIRLWLGAANRDPDQFHDPDLLDLARTPNRHLGFGHGIHFCLGASLARLEGRIALRHLVDSTECIELLDPKQTWRRSLTMRGLATLRISLRARRSSRLDVSSKARMESTSC